MGGTSIAAKPVGVEESEIEAIFAEATGAQLGELFAEAVHGTRDLPLETLLAPFGITLAPELDKNGKPSLGARVRNGADCTLAAVHEGSAAQKAGLSAGDVLIAIDGLRVTGSNLDTLLVALSAGREGRSPRVPPRRAAHRASQTGRA